MSLLLYVDAKENSVQQNEYTKTSLAETKKSADAAVVSAEAARTIANTATEQSEVIRTQAEAAARSASISEKAFVAGQRAWVGPLNASTEKEPTLSEAFPIKVQYQNTGREPAIRMTYTLDVLVNTPLEEIKAESSSVKKTLIAKEVCMKAKLGQSGVVVYPTSGFGNRYDLNFQVSKDKIDADVLAGDKIIYAHGCFVYETLKTTHHSFFCYYYRHGHTKIAAFNICEIGNDSD